MVHIEILVQDWVLAKEHVALFSDFASAVQRIVTDGLRAASREHWLNARPSDVEVEIRARGLLDVRQCDIAIIVTAQDWPERAVNLNARRRIMGEQIRTVRRPKDAPCSLWLRLFPSSSGRC